MPIITVSNNKIKEIVKLHQKKYRDETGLFIAEGIKAVEEVLNENIEIVDLFILEDIQNNNKYSGKIIPENIMKKISTTSSVCEALVVAKKKEISKKSFKELKKIALFESISDPGNLGTILRSASAFKLDGIILFSDCVDLYSPKVIRSSAGNFFKTPVLTVNTISELKELFPAQNYISTALSKGNNISLEECKVLDKYIIMFGSEAKGLKKETASIAKKNIKLDMSNNVESLNLSVSASIIFYELSAKQKTTVE